MHDAQLALFRLPGTALATGARPSVGRSLGLYGLGVACLATIGLFAAALPAIWIVILAVSATASFVLGLSAACVDRPTPRAIAPESIASHDLRETYRTVLFALAELDRAGADAPRLGASVDPVLERCRAAVITCGRMARLADPLQQYLDAHDPAYLRWELDRLRARTAATRDEATVAALTHAAEARARQLATYTQIAGQRDRIHARLELVRATLESFTATIVKLQGAGEEQLVLAGESMAEHLDELGDELSALEAALETDLAA